MTLKQKLQNPFALVAQGFVGGAILFWATTALSDSPPSNPPADRPAASADTRA
jgi:hypothetical protein